MPSAADYKYLRGPDVTGAFRAGAEFVDTAETREAQRQRALEQSIRAEKELAIKQAEEARRVQADRRAAATSAEILRQLGAGAQGPSTTTPTTPTTPGVRTSTAQLPQTQVTVTPGGQPTPTPGVRTPGQASAPSGAAPRAGTTTVHVYDPKTRTTVVKETPQATPGPTPGAAPSGAAPSGASGRPPGMMPLGAGGVDPTATQPPQGAPSRAPSIEDKFVGFNSTARQHVGAIRRNLRGVRDIPELADVKTVTASEYKKSQAARRRVIDANLRLLQSFNPSFMSRLTPSTLEAQYTTAEVKRMLDFDKQARAAQKWYGTAKARKIFEANPELFRQAKLDPITFYEQYKGVRPGGAPPATPPQPSGSPQGRQGVKVGPSAAEVAQRTPVDRVASVPLASLLNVEQRKRDLKQFDDAIKRMQQQVASLAKARKNVQALGILGKVKALMSERARYANLVNLAEFEISGSDAIIDQIARSGGAPIRIKQTNVPNTYAIYRVAPDGTIPRKPAGFATKKELVDNYKMFYDQKYAERKQKEADDIVKKALDFKDFRNRKELELAHKQAAKEFGLTFRRDEGTGITVVYRGINPVIGFRIIEVKDALGNPSIRREIVPLSQ